MVLTGYLSNPFSMNFPACFSYGNSFRQIVYKTMPANSGGKAIPGWGPNKRATKKPFTCVPIWFQLVSGASATAYQML
jgi:hypothetical protein